MRKARVFVERCQSWPGDGGFFFTPSNDVQNKAGEVDGKNRSYGTMTADGIRALRRLGVPRDDPRVQAAARWLYERFSVSVPPGDFPEDRLWQRESAWYYYVWSLPHALMALGVLDVPTPRGPIRWPVALPEELLRRQRPDGSWVNSWTAMQEDDPLVATPLALAGLGISRMLLTAEWRTSVPDVPAE